MLPRLGSARTGSERTSPERGTSVLLACSLVFAVAYWSPAFVRPEATGFGDWQYFHHMWEVAWVALVRYGEIALYDPHQCGGVPLWGDPQAQTFGPWFLLAIAFGTTLALKLGVVLHAAVGFFGMARYAEDEHRLSRPSALLAATVFAGSGFFAWHIAGGHAAFLPFYFAPLLAWSVRKAYDDTRFAVLGAGLLALTLYEGGVYPLPYFVLVVGLETVLDRASSELPRAIVRSMSIGLLAGLLGSARLLAVMVELGRHPRPTQVDDHLGLDELVSFLTTRDHAWRVPGHPYVWPEYCAYVGIAVVVLGVVGYHVAVRRGRARLVVGTALVTLLMMGDLGEWSPWALLHRLPVFDSLRVPSRFAVFVAAELGLLAALAVDAVAERWRVRGRRRTVLASFVALAIAIDLFVTTRPITDRWDQPALPGLDRRASFVQEPASTFASSFAAYPRLGHGSVGCYVVLDYQPARGLRVGAVPQAWIARGDGSVRIVSRTTNTVTLDVDARSAVTAVVNQNHAPDFVADRGTVVAVDGLLAVELPRGRTRVELAFRPASIRFGILPTLIGIALSVASFVVEHRRRSRVARTKPSSARPRAT